MTELHLFEVDEDSKVTSEKNQVPFLILITILIITI